MPILRFGATRLQRERPRFRPLFNALNVLSMLALGAFSMVFFFAAIRDISIFAAGFLIPKPSLESISTFSIEFAIGLTLVLLAVGIFQAVKGPGVQHVEVPLKGLPKAFDGFRIAQISDLHIGPTIRSSYVQNVVRRVNDLKADIVALTGDITDGDVVELTPIAKELSEMEATFGRFFVTGNHEYYHDAPAWIDVHKESGTTVLTNQNYLIEKDGERLAILGVPDVSAHHFVPEHKSSPESAAAGVPTDVIKILLAHQPISYKAAHSAGVHLQLSGHTHSGQFFPWNLMIGFFHDYYRGLNRFQDMWIYVNPGTGYWGPPLRTAVASEITLLTLRAE
jgi:hypothetical protein